MLGLQQEGRVLLVVQQQGFTEFVSVFITDDLVHDYFFQMSKF
jgi:hypothetical protein